MRTYTPYARLVTVGDSLALESSYDALLVQLIKALPYAHRKWDGPNKRWIIDPSEAKKVVAIVQSTLNITMTIPPVSGTPTLDTRTFEVQYLGTTKTLPDGTDAARGFVGSGWDILFPEKVLRSWFKDDLPEPTPNTPQPPKQTAPTTLYAVLGLSRTCEQDAIKPAYRTMAKQWHPDHCKEPDATERFMQIQHAYDVLSDLKGRKKYDIGLTLEMRHGTRTVDPVPVVNVHSGYGYRAPYRCGLVLVVGSMKMGVFHVQKIADWQEITRGGKTMVSSWDSAANTFVIDWV